jgi:hypothetical protein
MPRFLRIALAVVATLLAIVIGPAASTAMGVAETTYDPFSHAYDHPSSHAAPLAEVPSVRVRHPADGAVSRGGQSESSDFAAAAETAETAAVDVGHAGIHQFPGVVARKSQFFDGVNLGRLTDTGDLAGVVQKNGNIRFVVRGAEDVGVDRTTGLPTDIYTVIRKPDGSVLTMFPGTSPMS